jgi:hypothetical protein
VSPAESLAHRERRAGVLPEEEVLDRDRGRLVLLDQVRHARVDTCEPPLERLALVGGYDTSVESGQAVPVREHDAVTGRRRARVYPEDDHHRLDSAWRAGRLPLPWRPGGA